MMIVFLISLSTYMGRWPIFFSLLDHHHHPAFQHRWVFFCYIKLIDINNNLVFILINKNRLINQLFYPNMNLIVSKILKSDLNNTSINSESEF